MKKLTIESSGTSRFNIKDDRGRISSLTYTSWFSFKADLQLPNGVLYQFEPEGAWGTTIALKKDGRVVLTFKMHWNGNIIIESALGGMDRDFTFKPKSMFKSAYILSDKNDPELLVLQPQVKWSLNFNYLAEVDEIYEDAEHNDVMTGVALHCANYYMTMMTVIA